MLQTTIETIEDKKWLWEVHKITTDYAIAIIYGNEDYPERIETYRENNINCSPQVYLPNDSGQYLLQNLDCGHPESPHSDITRGYGTDHNGKTSCYDCCEKQDKKRIAASNPGDEFIAYMSSDSKSITNWPGRVLGKIVRDTKQYNHFSIDYLHCIRVRMFDGSIWTSRCSGPGMYCRLTKSKMK